MILTITPNPALDVSGTVLKLVANEKSYVTNELRLTGGNGINAAKIAHRLGAEVLATGFLGGNSGKEFEELLKSEHLSHQFVEIKGKTRTNITISVDNSHEQTRLSFPGPKIRAQEMASLLELMESYSPSLVIVGGSLPVGTTHLFIKKIIKKFNQKKIPVFVDVPGNILQQVIASKPFFIKPNLTEFQEMSGKKISKLTDVLKVARKQSSPIALQCISSVEGGALLVTKEHAWFGKIPKIKVKSTVGAGDSMVGAMAYSFVKENMSLNELKCEKMLRLGLAAACATLSNPGLTLGSRASIKAYYPQIMIKQID